MGSEEPKIEKLAPGVSRAVEPESPAALAMKRAMDKRKGAEAVAKVTQRACSKCGQPGHNAKTCGKAKSGETPPRKKYARRGPKKLSPRAVVHVPDAKPALLGVPTDVPAAGLMHMIHEGHRLMDRIERLFGKQ